MLNLAEHVQKTPQRRSRPARPDVLAQDREALLINLEVAEDCALRARREPQNREMLLNLARGAYFATLTWKH